MDEIITVLTHDENGGLYYAFMSNFEANEKYNSVMFNDDVSPDWINYIDSDYNIGGY
jgi:hypothetical protein